MTQRRPRLLFWLLLLAGLFIILFWLGRKGWRIYQAGQSLLAAQTTAETLLANGATQADPDALESLLHGVRRDVVVLRDETAVFMPLTPYLGWVPELGPTLLVAPQLMEMADSGTETAVHAFRGLKPALAALQAPPAPGSSRISQLAAILAAAETDLAQASRSFDQFVAARHHLGDSSTLPWRLQTALTQLDDLLPLGQTAFKAAPLLPDLLGSNGSRRYLILAQNEDERRATGGFITGAGMLRIENGNIVELTFQDANFVDNWRDKPYAFPPQPLYDFMRLELFLFRDANFWPDFPASARKAADLYSYGQDVPPPDGVIAIDQRFMQLLVEVTGPIPIADSDQVIDSQNIIDTLRGARDIQEGQTVGDWIFNRKDFLGIFANAIRTRIEQDFGSLDPVYLARNMLAAIDGKHLQLYMADADLAQTLAELGWSGSLPQPQNRDFLFVVDTNMGYNKANVFVQRQIQYDVTLLPDGSANSRLLLTYDHTASPSAEPCLQDVSAEYSVADSYLSLAEKCYWNYLRIYTPLGAELREAAAHVVPGETMFSGVDWRGEAMTNEEFPQLNTFSNFFLLERGESLVSSYLYATPAVVRRTADFQTYQLDVFKQAGSSGEPIVINITLPQGATFLSSTPEPTTISPTTISFSSQLTSDQSYTITFR